MPDTPSPAGESPEPPLALVREALAGLRYGQVLVTIHDGRIVQIDRTERRRLPPGPPGALP